jgi:protein-disulfide isomerase
MKRPSTRCLALSALTGLVCLLPACAPEAPSANPAPADAAASPSAATVGGATITLADVDARLQRDEPDTWQQFYEARRRTLATLVNERLLDDEARQQGVSVDSLVARRYAALRDITDSDVEGFYQQNEARMGAPLDSLRGRIRDYLEQGQQQRAVAGYVSELRQAADVQIHLDPPRVAIGVSADERVLGPATAPVTIVEYSDFECPYCVRAQPAVTQILETYGDRVRLVFRDFPLRMHDNAHLAAQAARCAGEQERFWDYHDVLFENYRALRPADLQRYAAELDLDLAPFADCLDSGRYAEAVDADAASGAQFGVSGTPAFFINGRLLSGAQPFAAFQQVIDEELALAGGDSQ